MEPPSLMMSPQLSLFMSNRRLGMYVCMLKRMSGSVEWAQVSIKQKESPRLINREEGVG